MNNIKCHNLVIFSFKIRIKHKSSLSVNQTMKNFKNQQYCPCIIASILFPYASWFSYYWNMVTILITAAFIGAALITGGGGCLLEGGACFNVDTQRWGAYYMAAFFWNPGVYKGKYGIHIHIVMLLK